jgi:hypothetical protein
VLNNFFQIFRHLFQFSVHVFSHLVSKQKSMMSYSVLSHFMNKEPISLKSISVCSSPYHNDAKPKCMHFSSSSSMLHLTHISLLDLTLTHMNMKFNFLKYKIQYIL